MTIFTHQEFMALIAQHILDKHFQMVRYYDCILLSCHLQQFQLLFSGSGVYAGSLAAIQADYADPDTASICMFFDRRVGTLGKALSER
jgi:hypothetical protein